MQADRSVRQSPALQKPTLHVTEAQEAGITSCCRDRIARDWRSRAHVAAVSACRSASRERACADRAAAASARRLRTASAAAARSRNLPSGDVECL